MKRSIHLTGGTTGPSPFTPAVEANGFVFVSGQLATEMGTNRLHTENITVETQKVMENIGTILQAAGLGYDDLVKCTIYLTNLQFYAEMSRVYLSFFKGDAPARETICVKELPRGVNLQISGIACRS
jgi:2-iminobutanoate/2-iminopropanoate deaminase